MRCKKHLSDLSSSVGVCATCLRERLFALIAVQAQAEAQVEQQQQTREDRRKRDPPPLVFPRSVSPYVSGRESDDHRFHSTPQHGPTSIASGNLSSKKKNSKFSLLSNLFSTRSSKYNLDLKNSDSCRKKEESTAVDRRDCPITNRGMSPVSGVDFEEDCDRSPSEQYRRTPLPAVRRTRNRNLSGLAFCLSPLVRASPNRHWNQKGSLPPDMAFSGEIRASVKPRLSTAASFCANRSRKLADFGRVNHNR